MIKPNKSPWEAKPYGAKTSGIAMGYITRVYPESRTCEIKTFAGNPENCDNHIPNAQWLSLDAHPDGDESTSIPKSGAICLVFFVSGQPFVWGFLNPINKDGGAVNTDQEISAKEVLNEGDKAMKATAGNRLILRAHGEVELVSTETCKIMLFPEDEELISIICKNYELATDGGQIDWKIDENDKTKYNAQYNDDLKESNALIDEIGTVDPEDESIIFRRTVLNDVGEVFTQTINNDGEFTEFIRARLKDDGYLKNIKPDGTEKMVIGGKLIIEKKPDGSMSIKSNSNKAVFNILPSGETSLSVNGGKALLTAEASGSVNILAGSGKCKILIGAGGNITMEASSTVNCKAQTVNLQGSKVNLGSSVSDSVPMGRLILKMLNKFITTFNSHIHVLPPLIGGPSSTPTMTAMPIMEDVLSKTVKVQQ